MAKIFFHRPRHQLGGEHGDLGPFYSEVALALADEGHEIEERERVTQVASDIYEEPGFHFVHQGLVQMPRVLNTAAAYVDTVWYADPMGVYGDSSVATADFDPAKIPVRKGPRILSRFRTKYVEPRKSRLQQKQRKTSFDEGAISVFLQGPSLALSRAAYMSEIEMVKTILENAQGRPVLVKPHPVNRDDKARKALRELAGEHKNLIVTDANLHDMLAASDLCCTISSAVGIEAMIHECPVVLFGKTDYHHCAVTVKTPEDFPKAMERALFEDWPFGQFLFWFLAQQSLDLWRSDWTEKLLKRMRDNGFED